MSFVDVNLLKRQADCTYRGDEYSARDNGAAFRHSRSGKRKRPLDAIWTFGTPCGSTGYMKRSVGARRPKQCSPSGSRDRQDPGRACDRISHVLVQVSSEILCTRIHRVSATHRGWLRAKTLRLQ